MANYTTTADIILSLNGNQAKKMMSALEKDASRLEKAIAKAASAGDKATTKKLQRELNSTKKAMEQLKGTASSVDNTLRRLDKATPKELNRALRQLQNQLNGIERGSAAWDAHVRKIQAVKKELAEINGELSAGQSGWDKLKDKISDAFGAIGLGVMGATVAIAGVKAAVSSYAELDQEMANVRKYTGMSAEEVANLNEELKKIDTRTSLEGLHQLAQEAGRLGKTSTEDVLGFVRAADKINVALDDLGEGATLTLSKLTGIFGDEQRLGTEKALLSVGSVINELSQNCAASAPFLAEFASRMGGVGSQAGLTVQQIMAFGAVLDSAGAKVEASSTALSQVIVRIFKDPAKYAEAAGMDVQSFTELVKTDMNAAVISLLESLNKVGGMDKLAPLFADMGEKGSRAVETLSVLATQIDAVKSQQIVANDAFAEATSIDKEFAVQNETMQAQMDKTGKALRQMAQELGQQLAPMADFAMRSLTVLMGVVKTLIGFISDHKAAIIGAAAAWLYYQAIVMRAAAETKIMAALTAGMNAIQATVRSVTLACSVAYNTLAGNMTRAAAQKMLNVAMKSSPLGIIIALAGAAAAALISLAKRTSEAKEAARQERIEEEKWVKSLTDISEAASKSCAEQVRRLKSLYQAATDEAKSTDERRSAAEKLQKLYPDYFKNMSTEEIMVGKAKSAYDNLRTSIIGAARARAAAAKIEQNEAQLLDLEDQLEQERTTQKQRQKEYKTATAAQTKAEREHRHAVDAAAVGDAREMNSSEVQAHVNAINRANEAAGTAVRNLNAANDAVAKTQKKINEVNAANDKLAKKYNISAGTTAQELENPELPTTTPNVGGSGGSSSGSGKGKTEDKLAAAKEEHEKLRLMAEIAWRTGKLNQQEYYTELARIDATYYDDLLKRTDLTDKERLEFEAKYYEAAEKISEQNRKVDLEKETRFHNERVAELKDFYLKGEISKTTYDEKIEEEEIRHQQALVDAATEGSAERVDAESKLTDMLIRQQERRRKETEDAEKKYAEERKKMFGMSPSEKQAAMNAELAALQSMYDSELAAAQGNNEQRLWLEEAFQKARKGIMDKYADEQSSGYKGAIEKSAEWLNGDGGKALTGTMSTLTSGMSAMFSQLTAGIQADLEVQTAAINKRYDAEISRAEGNSYRVRKLEKQKEAEIAKAKNAANKKMFAMQVIQAVAQTATNALNAYGSAAAIPVVGHILAPIAASLAVAAGMMQVATLKKQQAASEAQGYAEGGFTPKGGKYEPVGVVHAGEWVASQKLVNNPRTRPVLEALDYAQRNNTIGSLTPASVSQMITAPALAATSAMQPVVVQSHPAQVVVNDSPELTAAITSLNTRLNEPFVTVNTVTGDTGIKQAQDEYEKLIRNKTPKSRR